MYKLRDKEVARNYKTAIDQQIQKQERELEERVKEVTKLDRLRTLNPHGTRKTGEGSTESKNKNEKRQRQIQRSTGQ
ncbi:hypothetical protein ILUMI_05049 [Ignelater luminosus]|uniref:Uncharacterized protein n=1 Tax=Ignelater luminosus TaxID=2038154 RepID=A0A8K0GGR2_IGNLU|nr:hypothetical protein ILUMI_05049 [Ignelater luminosus]